MKAITSFADLEALPIWIVFDQVPQPDGKKPKKIPYTPGTQRKARVNDPSTCRTYVEAVTDFERTGRLPGFRLPPGLTLIDIDGRIDRTLIAEIDSLAEESVNGGTHIVCRGLPPDTFIAPPGVEIYPGTGGRFVLPTRRFIDGRDTIHDRTDLLARLFPPRPVAQLITSSTDLTADDQTIVARLQRMPHMWQLYADGDCSAYRNDHSRGDQALCNAFVSCGATDEVQIDRLFRTSALMREKWERTDYQSRTIAKALDGTVSPWDGWRQPEPTPRQPPVPPSTSDQDLRAENARLHAELARCCDDRAELRAKTAQLTAERDQARADLAAVMQTLANSNLGGDAAGKALVLAAAEVQHRAHTVPPSNGYVQVNASRIADRTAYVDGKPVPVPARISPRTITKYIGLAAEAGLINAKKAAIPAPVGKPAIKNEGWYWKAAPTLADQLAPLTSGSVYRENNPRPLRGGDPAKRRRLKTLPGCPECGGHHVTCATCGTGYETPAAIDLDSGETLSTNDLHSEERWHSEPPSTRHTPPVVTVHMSTSLSAAARSHAVPPEVRERRERAAADLELREPSWLRDVPSPGSPAAPAIAR